MGERMATLFGVDGMPTRVQYKSRWRDYADLRAQIEVLRSDRTPTRPMRSQDVDWPHFLDRVSAVEYLRDILGDDGMPNRDIYHDRMETDPALREEVWRARRDAGSKMSRGTFRDFHFRLNVNAGAR
jgi:hypothetical protein